MRIGFVGVGKMGHGMALNLLDAGHDLTVIAHRNRAPIEDLLSRGATEASSLSALAEAADVVILCVTGTGAAREVVAALLPGLRTGSLVIDTTTNEAEGPEELAAMLGARGIDYVEAPLTGGVQQARDGVLGAIVGCESERILDAARPVLSAFCRQIERFGPVGMGARTKLVSNFLALGTATVVIEAFRQARSLGVDWTKLYELAQLGSGNSSGLKRIVGNAIEGDYEGYVFTIDNTLKDFTYLCRLSEDRGELPALASVMKRFYEQACDAGLGPRMISELLDPDVDPSAGS